MLDARLLESLVPLGSLSLRHRQQLADQAELRRASAGDALPCSGPASPLRLYLLSGSVEIDDGRGAPRRLDADSAAARRPLGSAGTSPLRVRCLEACRYLAIDAGLCDALLTWDQGQPQAPAERIADDDWMSRLLMLPLFRQLPPEHLFGLMRRFEPMQARAGQRLIEQGAVGDYFYLLIEGRCGVQRVNPDGRAVTLAELKEGACFGDEALISGEPRNASVTALVPSRLLRLSRQDFQVLLRDPLLRKLSSAEAEALIASGTGFLLDVRLPAEFRAAHLPHSLNLPLHTLRLKRATLEPGKTYIAICDTGRRSAVAAWLLRERGLEAYSLAGGWPALR